MSEHGSINRALGIDVKEFADKLIEHYEYDSCSVSISRHTGETKVEFVINKDRAFCPTCGNCFLSRYQLENHKSSKPAGCLACRKCFTNDDHVIHALESEHDRCFVVGCRSPEREEARWLNFSIRAHVKEKHGCSNEASPPQYSSAA